MFEQLIRRGTLLTVAVLIFCVLGLAAVSRTPVQMIPDLEVRTVSVQTGWPGATPQDIEQEILIEQEQYLRVLPNLRRMISYAETGSGEIELEFPFGVDVNEALIRVANALSQVTAYPENVDEPRLFTSSFSENAFMYFRLMPRDANPLGLDMNLMRDFADDFVRPRMERVPGVSQVSVGGGAERMVRIEVDSARLAERGITLLDVRDAVRGRNRDSSGGDIDSGRQRYLVRTIGRFDTIEEVENLIVARRGDAIVRLSDIADVRLHHAELREHSLTRGQPALTLSVRREPGSNVISIKNGLLPVMDELNAGVLAQNGLELQLISDDVRYVEESVANVIVNLALGATLATIVLFLFLRSARATLIGVLGIPICALAALVGLLVVGRTINVISLAGVAFALGMTLDNSIVVLESIEQARRRGLDRLRAAAEGVREVWPAVLASTMTTVLVFAPVLFIREEAGQLYSDVAIAISGAILASMLVAVALVPTATASRRLGPRAPSARPSGAGVDAPGLGAAIGALFATPRRRALCIALPLGVTAAMLVWLTPPAEYLPEGEEPKVFSRMIPPPGYNLTEMTRIGEQVQSALLPYVDADPELFARGEAPVPAMKTFNLSIAATGLDLMTEPVNADETDELLVAINEHFETYSGMRAFGSRGSIISSNDGGTRSVNLDISGPDLERLYAVAQAAYEHAEAMFENPQIDSAPASLSLDQPMLHVRPRWDRLAELGFSAQAFGYAVGALSDGAFVDEFFEGDDKIDIFMFSKAGSAQELAALRQLPVYAPSGAVVPLEAVAELRETFGADMIRRVDGRRTVTLNIIPPRSVALETAVGRVQSELLPALRQSGLVTPDVAIDISGAADQLDATRASLGRNFLVAVVLIYLVLVAIYGHWGYPLFVLATVPLGIAGGIGGLALLNGIGGLLPLLGIGAVQQSFDMITMLGFLILLGTVTNNPILIVDRTSNNLATGVFSVVDAVRDAVDSRVRPILMSTLTTAFGLLPLVIIPGAGTELYRGLGAVVLAGLLSSMVVTLVFLPALLVTVLSRTKRARSAEAAAPDMRPQSNLGAIET